MTPNGDEPKTDVVTEVEPHVAVNCEGADIEKLEKLYKNQPETETETCVVISSADLKEYNDLCDSDKAWEILVKTHSTDLMEKQKVITSSIKGFWRKLAIIYELDMTKSFFISAVTGEIKEGPKTQEGGS